MTIDDILLELKIEELVHADDRRRAAVADAEQMRRHRETIVVSRARERIASAFTQIALWLDRGAVERAVPGMSGLPIGRETDNTYSL
jgi:hypothetical protein